MQKRIKHRGRTPVNCCITEKRFADFALYTGEKKKENFLYHKKRNAGLS